MGKASKVDWSELLRTAPTRSFEGRLMRCIPQLTFVTGTPPSYLFTSRHVNRCNAKGISCIYMGEDRDTVDCEYRSYYTDPEPQLTYFADFVAASIIDFETDDALVHFSLSAKDFFESFRLITTLIALQLLGKAIHEQSRVVAIRFLSNACHAESKVGFNWAIFPKAVQDPDFLKILGRRSDMLEQWPKH